MDDRERSEELLYQISDAISREDIIGLEALITENGWCSLICKQLVANEKLKMLRHFHTRYCKSYKPRYPVFPNESETEEIHSLAVEVKKDWDPQVIEQYKLKLKAPCTSANVMVLANQISSQDVYLIRARYCENINNEQSCIYSSYDACNNALVNGSISCYDYLIKNGAKSPVNPLVSAAKSGKYECIRKFHRALFTPEIISDIFIYGDLESIKFVVAHKIWPEELISALIKRDFAAAVDFLSVSGKISDYKRYIPIAIEAQAPGCLYILYENVMRMAAPSK